MNSERCVIREPQGFWWSLGVRGRLSYDKWGVEIGCFEESVLFYFTTSTFCKTVEAQVVLLVVYFVEQTAFEIFVLHAVYATFEYGFLDSLADSFAHFGDAAQALPPLARFGVYVITNDDQHDYLRKNGT